MRVKDFLRNIDVTTEKLATALNLPLDQMEYYINLLEKDIPITNVTYSSIFGYLFDNENITKVQFANKISEINLYLHGKENVNTNLDNANLTDYFLDSNSNQNIINVIKLFIKNEHNELVNEIASYFSYVNGYELYIEENKSDQQKAFYSRMCQLFNDYINQSITIDPGSYGDFISKANKVFQKNLETMDSKILLYIKECVASGIAIDTNHVKEIMSDRG